MNFLKSGFQAALIVLILFSFAFQGQESASKEHKQEHSNIEGQRDANRHMHKADFETLVKHFEDPERETWQKPELVIKKISVLAGGTLKEKTIADIGAGSGYFTFRLARAAKKVIAIDIDERFLNYIRSKNDSLKLPIETRLVPEDDPELTFGEADIVLSVNTYHHINKRRAYFEKVRNALKPDGVLIIIDFKKENMPVGPPLKMKVTAQTAKEELKQAGFNSSEIDQESLAYQYIITVK